MTLRPQASAPTRRQWLLLFCLFALALPAVTTRIYSSDEIQYFAYLRSLWFDRDLSFDNEYRYFYDRGIARSEGFHETFLERQTEAGRRVNFGTIGCAILWAPFYAAGDLAARATGAPADGFSRPYIAAVAYGSAVYGFAGLLLAVLAAERLRLPAAGAAAAIWLGTPLLFYMYVAPPFSHACSAFAVALFVWTWLRVRDAWSPRGSLLLGAAAALMAMVREQDLFFIAGPAVDFAWTIVRRDGPRREWRSTMTAALAAAIGFILVFLPQALAYVRLNGHLGPSRLVMRKMSWHAPHALQVLLSPEHGFFVWTPLALVAIAGLMVMARDRRPASADLPPQGGSYKDLSESPVASAFRRKHQIATCLLIMIALQVYVSGSVESWTVAGAFGQRRFVALTAPLVIGLAALFRAVDGRVSARMLPRSTGRALVLIVALGVYWNVALIAEFATGLMDRQRLEPARNAYDAFVTLPRQLPSLAYRYLFDRGSFYEKKAAS